MKNANVEEMKIQVYPMDYEEFCNATGNNYELLHQIYEMGTAIGQATNRKGREFVVKTVISDAISYQIKSDCNKQIMRDGLIWTLS